MIKDCSIIVSIKKNISIVTRFLQSLERNCEGAEIVITDNKCESKLSDLLVEKSTLNNWKLIKGSGLNAVQSIVETAKHATKKYLIFPGADTIFAKNSASLLLECLRNNNVGISIPSTSYDDHEVTSLQDTKIDWTDDEIENFAKTLNYNPAICDFKKWPMGFCYAMRRNVYDEVGGLDPQSTFFSADFDLFYRVVLKNYKLVWHKNAYVHHFGHAIVGKRDVKALVDECFEFFNEKYGKKWFCEFKIKGYI